MLLSVFFPLQLRPPGLNSMRSNLVTLFADIFVWLNYRRSGHPSSLLMYLHCNLSTLSYLDVKPHSGCMSPHPTHYCVNPYSNCIYLPRVYPDVVYIHTTKPAKTSTQTRKGKIPATSNLAYAKRLWYIFQKPK